MKGKGECKVRFIRPLLWRGRVGNRGTHRGK